MPQTSTPDIEQVLQQRFGLTSFRTGQLAVVERLLRGKSSAAVFPTGGGKSLCYQLPAVMLDHLTLVVSPLLALMREQVDYLNQLGIPAARIDSSLSAEELRLVMQQVRSGQIKLLYVAPERFFNERFRQFIQDLPISLFAIDEAHCISQWGHNFRPDYLKLARAARELKAERILALTATATPAVLEDIRREFGIAAEDAIQTAFHRSNLRLRFTPCSSRERDALLLSRLKSAPRQPTLVYVSLQRSAEHVAEVLQAHDLDARAYHAGLPAEERAEIQDWFMNSEQAIVVATIAFGMGIDKANIRAIYHYNASKSIENFVQEIGRAGRDGENADCETLIVPEDRVVLDNFAYGDTPSLLGLRKFVQFIAGQPQEFFVSYYSLAYETDIRESVVRTLMTYLELADLLEATAPRYEKYEFKPKLTSSQILNQLQAERRSFAASVLALTVKKKIWFEINLAQAANRLRCDRNRIVRMLDYFAEQGWIEMRASGLVYGYRQLKKITDVEQLVQQLHAYVMDRETGELSRLSELFELFVASRCQSAMLSEHFGQPMLSDCGQCAVCNNHAIDQLPPPAQARVGDSAIKALQQLAQKHRDALAEPRQQARFLCGLSSPQSIRARLTRDPLFGCCAAVPFDQVLQTLTTQPVRL
ncbi:MAG: RecQ family ATP-dependent DNA helicase [bacterium]|nr:RecQ family ATP-dependent DNA helicase [bacterium]